MLSAVVWSNFFRVTSGKDFERFIQKWDLTPMRRDTDQVGFHRTGKESFGIPRAHRNNEGRPVVGDLFKDLARLLLDGEVAVVIENVIAPERGVVRISAVAVKRDTEPLRLSINQIYDMVVERWQIIPTKVDWAT